jgi:hypothetical protein
VIPFISYALNGFAEGLRGQVAYVRSLQIDVTWRNYIHEEFRNSRTKAAHRQRNILLDIFDKEDGVQISEIPQLSPRLASDYAKVHKLTVYRDVDFLCDKNLLLRLGKKVTANRSLIEQFLPIRANTS